MQRLIVLLLLLLMSAPPALAGTASDFIAAEKAKGISLAGVCGTDPSDPKFRLDGAPGATPEQMAQALADAQVFDWSVAPVADSDGAKLAILSDPDLISVVGNLFQLISIVDNYVKNPALAKRGWAAAKLIFGPKATPGSGTPEWLTAGVAGKIEQHCFDHGIPLI